MSEPLRAAIRAAERRAMGWVSANLPRFNPLTEHERDEMLFRMKAATELAVLCGKVHALPGAVGAPYREATRFVWEEIFCHPAARDYLLRDVGRLLALNIYAMLRQCGYEDGAFRAALVAKLDYLLAVERPPFRRMDLLESLELAGIAHGAGDAAALYPQTILAARPDAYDLTSDDVYAITHILFFVTKWGARDAAVVGADRAYLRRLLPRLLRFYLREGNWDLTSELLICLRAVGLRDDPAYVLGWRLLLDAQWPDGSVPYLQKVGAAAPADLDAPSRFRRNYHTTLATLLACHICLAD